MDYIWLFLIQGGLWFLKGVFFCVYFYLLNFNAFYVPCVVIELVDLVSNSEVIDLLFCLFCLGDDFGVFYFYFFFYI